MLTGLHSAAAAMKSGTEYQDVIANNLANADTPGFKRSAVSFASYVSQSQIANETPDDNPPPHVPSVIPFPFVAEDMTQGRLLETGVSTHLAIEGPGHFVEDSPHGEKLTRAGNFSLDQLGFLISLDGNPILGEQGPIQILGNEWSVESNGDVIADGMLIDKLRIITLDDVEPGMVIQGRLETSNVNTVKEMVTMIAGMRSYEANQKMIQALDQILDKAINHMGRSA